MSSGVQVEVDRIRQLSKAGMHREALAAADALSAAEPHSRDALYLMAANQRCVNEIQSALATLQRLEGQHPRFSLLYQERGHCRLYLRDAHRAIEAFERAVELNPALATSWTLLERLYRLTGDAANAAKAAERISTLNQLPPEVVHAGSLVSDGEWSAAEFRLRAYLHNGGKHVEAMRLLARIAHLRNLLEEADALLDNALRLWPDSRALRFDYVRVLIDRQKYPRAREEVRRLLTLEPGNQEYRALYAAACAGLGEHASAIDVYRGLIEARPGSPELRVSLGHSLQAIGQSNDATACYQAAAAATPGFGDAWWSLANLKTYGFSHYEIARMRAAEGAPDATPADRVHLCFALGKALEVHREYAESWTFYVRGNALKRAESLYRAEIAEANTRNQMEVCTERLFRRHANVGAPDPDPIFIVGLPRSGSTLIEQILASHSQVEGTQELPEMHRIVTEMKDRYPALLSELPPLEFRALGERYLSSTRPYRLTTKPLFIDKLPNNFRHIGLIQLMLPNAKIIDVRREPMACCFSNFKQLFAGGQEFTYSIEDIARYYRGYLELMRHWDAVLPGKVLRVQYERVVDGLEGQVRRLVEFCGLQFEPACLAFYKTGRSIRTPSSEQVRQPIFREGLHQWRNYEEYLEGLKRSLGDALIRYAE